MSGNFLDQLKRLDAEDKDDCTFETRRKIEKLLADNHRAIIELVEAAEKQNEWQLKHAVYDIYLAEAVHNALAKLKGDV